MEDFTKGLTTELRVEGSVGSTRAKCVLYRKMCKGPVAGMSMICSRL
jgi:hypothetical protein